MKRATFDLGLIHVMGCWSNARSDFLNSREGGMLKLHPFMKIFMGVLP